MAMAKSAVLTLAPLREKIHPAATSTLPEMNGTRGLSCLVA